VSLQPLEDRVANLERMAREYEAKTVADDRLTLVVERLAEETVGLNAILTKVDEQQQRLTCLGNDLARVEQSSATKNDLSAAAKKQAETTKEFRRDTFRRIYTTGLLVIAALGVGATAFYDYQESRRAALRDLCEARNTQNSVILDMLEGSIADVPPNKQGSAETMRIKEGIARFESLITNCDEL
jgi:hypothetical protein